MKTKTKIVLGTTILLVLLLLIGVSAKKMTSGKEFVKEVKSMLKPEQQKKVHEAMRQGSDEPFLKLIKEGLKDESSAEKKHST